MDENETQRSTAELPEKRLTYVAGRRRFTREFKIRAVKMIKEDGASIAHTARTLDVSYGVLSRWLRQDKPSIASSSAGTEPMTKEQRMVRLLMTRARRMAQEIAQLQAARSKLVTENDILKGLVGHFARTPSNVAPSAQVAA